LKFFKRSIRSVRIQ